MTVCRDGGNVGGHDAPGWLLDEVCSDRLRHGRRVFGRWLDGCFGGDFLGCFGGDFDRRFLGRLSRDFDRRGSDGLRLGLRRGSDGLRLGLGRGGATGSAFDPVGLGGGLEGLGDLFGRRCVDRRFRADRGFVGREFGVDVLSGAELRQEGGSAA